MPLPLHALNGHLFVELDDRTFLVDTGAPSSFGVGDSVTLDSIKFPLPAAQMGLDAETISSLVGQRVSGLLGADIINAFDVLLDVRSGQITFATDPITLAGEAVAMDEFMGIPIVEAEISGVSRRMFFDTGAQLSYLQHDSVTTFPNQGVVADFYPGFGRFETETYAVDLIVGSIPFTLRCGVLPGLLGMTLTMAGTEGIIGNEIVLDRVVGYFPRRQQLVLA